MASRLRDTLRTARMEAILDDAQAGAGDGVLVIGTAGMATVLATWTINPVASGVVGDVLTLVMDEAEVTAAATGTAAAGEVRRSDGTLVIEGNLTGPGGGGFVTLDNPALVSGQTVRLSSFTYTHPAPAI